MKPIMGVLVMTGVPAGLSQPPVKRADVMLRIETLMDPGCGQKLVFEMARYANTPTVLHP
jgi:hypothetical protein